MRQIQWTVRTGRHLLTLSCLALAAAPLPAARADEPSVLLATTTSVRDTGLLESLLPVFSGETGIRVRTVAVGTGAALRMGAAGNADLLITHAPDAEAELVASGAAASRTPFMENHFVLAGPASDPAAVAEAADAAEAFRRIRAQGARYVSRADDSGTHKREQALMRSAGIGPQERWPGLLRTGTGMGLSLQLAGERRAYILSDLGTFLAYRERVGLVQLSRTEPALRNIYSILRIDPERFPGRLHAEEARRLESFLLRPDTQARIGRFGQERFGRALFRPLHARPASAGRGAAASDPDD